MHQSMTHLFKAKKLQIHSTKDKRDFPQHAMQVFVRKPCNPTALLPITTKAGESTPSKDDPCHREKEGKPRSELKIKNQET